MQQQVQQLLFPHILSMNCANFDHKESTYSHCDRGGKESSGELKNGSARSTITSMTGIPYCFTLEANYASSVRVNELKPRFNPLSK